MMRLTVGLVITALIVSSAAVAETDTRLLPELTPVPLMMDAEISSGVNKPGDRFPFHVTQNVVQGDAVLIPAGSTGEGEVVHAAKSKGGGRAGELILAARFVTVGDKQIRLRSFAAGSGKDRSNAALGVAVAVGFFGMLVRGSELVMAKGTAVSAKTAEEVRLPISAVVVGAVDPKVTHLNSEASKEPANE
jgi:hypothetical protein